MINFEQSNKYKNGYYPNFGDGSAAAQQSQNQVQLPPMYDSKNDAFQKVSGKESLKNSPMGMLFGSWIENPLITFITWLGVGAGIDAFANACGGEYNKSIVGKAANLGDKIHNSKFFQSEPMKKFGKFWGKGKEKTKNVLNTSQLFRAAKDMSIKPENSAAKGLMYTTKDEIVMEFVNHIAEQKEGLGLTEPKEAIELKHLYLTKEEQNFIKSNYGKEFNKIKGAEEAKVANHIVLKRLNLAPAEISNILSSSDANVKTKEEVLKLMSKDLNKPLTIDTLKDMSKNPSKYHDVVEKIAENTQGKVWCSAGGNKLGPLGKLFRRRISMDGIYNKSKSLGDGAKTSTGRIFSKALQTVYRGITFGGGKLAALLFIAPGLVEMVKNTIKADKDKKVGTAAWGFISSWSWVISFMLGGKLLYGAASMKNAGISKENVAKCDKIIDDFNENNEAKLYKSRKEYRDAKKLAKKQIKELRKVENQSLFNKLVAKLSGILSYDLKKFNGRRTDSAITTAINKFRVGIKGKSGLVIKFCLFMFAIMPFVDGILHKTSNLLFGKDYDPYTEDEKNSAKKEQDKFSKEDLYQRLMELQEHKINDAAELTQNKDREDVSVVNEDAAKNALLSSEIIKQAVNNNNNSTNTKTNMNTNVQNSGDTNVLQSQQQVKQKQAQSQINSSIAKTQNEYSHINSNNINVHDKYPQINSNRSEKDAQKTSDSYNKNKHDNYTYMPSPVCNIKSPKKESEANRYIPSQIGANVTKTFDNSGLSSALARADRAEQKALEVLSGKFVSS